MSEVLSYPFIEQGGHRRYLALLPRTAAIGEAGPLYGVGESPPMLPRTGWSEVDQSHLAAAIKDQDSLGYCHSYAGALAVQISCLLQGRDVRLSGTGLGSIVTGATNRGAGLEEVLAVVTRDGVPLESDVPEWDYRRKGWKAGWQERAKGQVVLEYYDCGYSHIFDAMSSGLQYGFVGIFGCSRPFGPHAMVATGLEKRGSAWGWKIANSWGTGEADSGFEHLAESQIGGLDQFGGWLIRAVTVREDEPAPALKA